MKYRHFYPRVGILLCFVFLMTGCTIFQKNGQQASNANADELQQENEQRKAEVKSSYEAQLVMILEPYWQSGVTAGIREQVLELKAPVDFLDLHLGIVIALDMIAQGKAEEGAAKMQALAEKYPWIKR